MFTNVAKSIINDQLDKLIWQYLIINGSLKQGIYATLALA